MSSRRDRGKPGTLRSRTRMMTVAARKQPMTELRHHPATVLPVRVSSRTTRTTTSSGSGFESATDAVDVLFVAAGAGEDEGGLPDPSRYLVKYHEGESTSSRTPAAQASLDPLPGLQAPRKGQTMARERRQCRDPAHTHGHAGILWRGPGTVFGIAR